MSTKVIIHCNLCGVVSTNPMKDVRCGGIINCICPKCESIVIKWEERKKAQRRAWHDAKHAENRMKAQARKALAVGNEEVVKT